MTDIFSLLITFNLSMTSISVLAGDGKCL